MSRRHLLPPRSTSKHTLTSKECGNSHLTLGCIRGGSLGYEEANTAKILSAVITNITSWLMCDHLFYLTQFRILYLTQFRKFEKLPLPGVWPGYASVHMRWHFDVTTEIRNTPQKINVSKVTSQDCFAPPGFSWSTGIWYHRGVWQFVMGRIEPDEMCYVCGLGILSS